jgi:hypothetical protein
VVTDTKISVNPGAAEKMGLVIPPAILESATKVETKS